MRRTTAAQAAILYGAVGVEAALPTVTAVGNKFFTSEGNQLFIKGIAYQLQPDDPLIDTDQCNRDAKLMKTLGANVIRIYHTDPDADHGGCMSAFAGVGIYTLIDLDTFNTQILPNNPQWNSTQYDTFAKVMDAFIQYDNVLGFFIGNEVILQKNQSEAAPFVKAAARDMKAYRDSKGYRKVPIGYSAADIKELRPMLQDYLTCGGNESEIVDFFALNSYSWCDPSDYKTSDYRELQEQAENFPVPIFFSETGCNKPGPRLFEDQAAIFSDPMLSTWSGSIVYEWIQEQNDYGLISYGEEVAATVTSGDVFDGFTRKGTPTPVSPDFENLKSQWATLSPTGVASSDYTPSVSTRNCPASSSGWLVDGNVRLPTLGDISSTSATGSATGDSDKSGSSGVREIVRTRIGLVGVLMFLVFWL